MRAANQPVSTTVIDCNGGPCKISTGGAPPIPGQNFNTGSVVVNIHSQPGAAESIINTASEAGSSVVSGISNGISSLAQRLPTVPPLKLPTLPPLPKLPTIPEKIKVPVRVRVETGSVTFPPPPQLPTLPSLPTLPPVVLPQKVTVGQVTLNRPELGSIRPPIQVVYEEVKPGTPILPQIKPPKLPTIRLPALRPATAPAPTPCGQQSGGLRIPFTVSAPPAPCPVAEEEGKQTVTVKVVKPQPSSQVCRICLSSEQY